MAMHIERDVGRSDVSGYMDDQAAYTEDFETHLEALDALLSVNAKYGILLNPEKTFLFRNELEFLGFRVNEGGIYPTEEWLSKICSWPQPKTQKDLMALLGFVQYYSGFIPEFAQLTARLNSAKAQKKLIWNDQLLNDFQQLKKAFIDCSGRPI